MKISRHASEKRTWKTVSGDFVSREFTVGREVEVPDAITPAELDVVEWGLLLELRRSVLMPFVLEGAMHQSEFQDAIALYEGMLATAKNPSVPPTPLPASAGVIDGQTGRATSVKDMQLDKASNALSF